MLERTRLLDDARRFERTWHALRERAEEIGVPELHVPGHRLVAELSERLENAEGLDAHVRCAVAEWRKAQETDASYRRLREQWHKHMALAEADHVHPHEIQGYAPLIDAMRELQHRAHLASSAWDALEMLVDNYDHYRQARTDIRNYLTGAEEVVQEHHDSVRIRSEYLARKRAREQRQVLRRVDTQGAGARRSRPSHP